MAVPSDTAAAARFACWQRAVMAWARTPSGGLTVLILVTLIARLLFAASLGLGIDESYMVAAGRELQLSYYDHPPIAWWLAWAAAHIAGNDGALVVRLPFIALFALTTVLMYRVTTALFDGWAGLWAAVVLNAAPVLGVTSASWVLPDGPLMAALLGAVAGLIRALRAEGRAAWGWWLGTGSCAGLALSSKYSAALTILGAILFLLTESTSRRWLSRPQPYMAGLATLVLFSPALIWNARHGWISFLFQGERAGGHFHPLGPLAAIAGAALYFLPWIWLPLVLCGVDALRRGPGDRSRWLLVCLAAPPIVFFTVVSLWSRVLFHWTAPGYLMLVPLLGEAIAHRCNRGYIRRLAIATGTLVVFGTALVAAEVRFNLLPTALTDLLPQHNQALAAVDWVSLRDELAKRGLLDRPRLVVAATRWLDAGKIDYALEGRIRVLCLGSDPRQYGITAPVGNYTGWDVLLAAPHLPPAQVAARFGSMFSSIDALEPVTVLHANRPAMTVPLYLGHGLRQVSAGTADNP